MTVKQRNPKAISDIRRNRRALVGKQIVIGWPKGTTAVSIMYPDGTPVLFVAVWNQFGATINHPGGTRYVVGSDGKSRFVSNEFVGPVTGITGPHQIKIPARDFMRPGGLAASKKVGAIMRKNIKLIHEGSIDNEALLKQAALVAEAELKKAIRKLRSPPNAPGTVARKKSSNPLVDTGLLIQSVTSDIR